MSRRKPSRAQARAKARRRTRPKYQWVVVPRRSRGRWLRRVGVGLALVAGAGVVGFAAWPRLFPPDLGPTTRAGSARLSTTEPIPPEAVPMAYDLEYRIEESATDTIVVTTQRNRVRRPFDSHLEIRDSGGTVKQVRMTNFAKLLVGEGPERKVLEVPPALATGDLRPDVVMAEAVATDVVERREQRRVLGRRCQVYRAAKPILGGELVPIANADQLELVDFCVDGAGLVLEEIWQSNRARRLTRRVATRIDTRPQFDDGLFSLAGLTAMTVEEGGGAVRAAPPDFEPPKGLWLLDVVPEGFQSVGRYAVTQPQLDIGANPLNEGDRPRARSIVDVWVRGADVLILDRGDGDPGTRPHARDVDMGPAGPGKSILDLRTSEVKAVLGEAGYVRILGTLPPKDLAAIAKNLRQAL